MSDLIKRESAIEAVNNLSDVFIDGKPPMKYATEVQDAINGLPTVEERKTGKWIVKDYPMPDWVRLECTACGEPLLQFLKVVGHSRYCPNCGARIMQ